MQQPVTIAYNNVQFVDWKHSCHVVEWCSARTELYSECTHSYFLHSEPLYALKLKNREMCEFWKELADFALREENQRLLFFFQLFIQ